MLIFLKQPINLTGFLAIAGGLFLLAALVQIGMTIKKQNRAEKVLDVMERVAATLKR